MIFLLRICLMRVFSKKSMIETFFACLHLFRYFLENFVLITLKSTWIKMGFNGKSTQYQNGQD